MANKHVKHMDGHSNCILDVAAASHPTACTLRRISLSNLCRRL